MLQALARRMEASRLALCIFAIWPLQKCALLHFSATSSLTSWNRVSSLRVVHILLVFDLFYCFGPRFHLNCCVYLDDAKVSVAGELQL
jgi:hypothetical protein